MPVTASRVSACCVRTTRRATAVLSAETGTGVMQWRERTVQVRWGLNETSWFGFTLIVCTFVDLN